MGGIESCLKHQPTTMASRQLPSVSHLWRRELQHCQEEPSHPFPSFFSCHPRLQPLNTQPLRPNPSKVRSTGASGGSRVCPAPCPAQLWHGTEPRHTPGPRQLQRPVVLLQTITALPLLFLPNPILASSNDRNPNLLSCVIPPRWRLSPGGIHA